MKKITKIILALVGVAGLAALNYQVPKSVEVETPLTPEMAALIDQYVAQSLADRNTFGAAAQPIAASTFTLAGGGVSSSATSITLQSFTVTQTGQKIQDSDLADTFYLTLEPGNRTKQEIVSCTTVTQNSNNTATLSGCSRGLSPITPYTASTTLQFAHAGGSQVTFSDPPQFFNLYAALADEETITNYWKVPDPVSLTDIANKQYVLSVVTGGTVTTDKVIVTGTAGETLSAGNLIFLNTADARWYKVDTDVSNSVTDVIIGIAQGSGTAGNAITSGVLMRGLDTNQSGLTEGANYFASATAGGITTSTSTLSVGKAKTTTNLHLEPHFALIPKLNANNTFTGTNTFATSTNIGSLAAWQIGKQKQVITTTGTSTFSVPSGITKVFVEVVGAGGSGGNCSVAGSAAGAGGGGGGGGYANEIVDLTGTTSVQVYVGTAGLDTHFGTNGHYLSATFGANSTGETAGGAGGIGLNGDLNLRGQGGDAGIKEVSSHDTASGGAGGSSHFGGGAAGVIDDNDGTAGSNYGGGGSGAACTNSVSHTGGAGAQGAVIIRW